LFKKVAFALILITISLLAEAAPPQAVALVEAYKSALEAQSIKPVEAHLARDFDFSGAGPEISRMVFEQVLSLGVMKLGEITSIEMNNTSNDRARLTFQTEVSVGDAEPQKTEDNFDIVLEGGVWKIAAIGTGALQAMLIEDPLKQSTFKIEGPALSEIPFPSDLEHIVVDVVLSGKPAKMIIDNGTPLSVIDLSIAEGFESIGEIAIAKAMGVSGDISNPGAVTVDEVTVGEIKVSNLTAVTMDLSHLSSALGVEIAGLLGTDFLGRFAWTIDYSSRKIFLSRLAEGGGLLDPNDKILKREPTHRIHFDREMHLLYTSAEFAKEMPANIILDCGAGGGVLTPEFFAKLPKKAFSVSGTDTLLGADTKRIEVQTIMPKKLTIGDISRKDYPIVISDLSHINSMGLPTPIDAIIGYNFFSDWLITTRFDESVVELRPIPK